MHAAIWKFTGEPDDLLRRHDAMIAETPTANMRLHICLRAQDGIMLVDACPHPRGVRGYGQRGLRSLRERHGLPDPAELHDYPVHVAFVDGAKTPST